MAGAIWATLSSPENARNAAPNLVRSTSGVRGGGPRPADLIDAGKSADRSGQVVVDDDEKPSHQPRERVERPGGYGHDPAAFWIAPRDLGVLQGQQHEHDERHEHEDRGPLVVTARGQDAWHVIDGRADVGEHDRPAQQRPKAPAADVAP